MTSYTPKTWVNNGPPALSAANIQIIDNGVQTAHQELQDHLDDTVDAHDASAISNVAAGSIVAIDVQTAINELDTEKVAKAGDTMTGNLTFSGAQKIIGGTSTTSDLTLQTTSGVGATGADMHFLVGNNGATEAMTILNNGSVGVGAPSVDGRTLMNIGGVDGLAFAGSATGTIDTTAVLVHPASIANTSGTGNFAVVKIGGTSLNPTSTSTTGAGLYVSPPAKGGAGSFTSMASLYIDDAPSGGTLNYALLVGSGNSFFGGDVVVGSTTEFQISGAKITKYNSNTTVGNGVSTIVGNVALTGQTGNITSTNIFTPPVNGMYKVTSYRECTTAGSAGQASIAIAWNDDNGAQSSSQALSLSSVGYTTATYIVRATTAASISYSVTLSGVTGSPVYALFLVVERLS